MAQKIEISYRTIVFTVLFLLGLWFVWSIWGIILQFFVAVIIMTAFNPLVNRLENLKVVNRKALSRSISIVVVYLAFILLVVGFIAMITQPLIVQTSNLLSQFPMLIDKFLGTGVGEEVLKQQLGQLNTLPADLLRIVTGIFSNILNVFTTLVMAFYLLLEREKLHKHLAFLFGNRDIEKKVEEFIDHLEEKLGGWVRAQIVLMLLVGGMTYIGLLLLGVPYALPFAIIAGLLEIIPNIGPTISAVPPIILAITYSPLAGLGVLLLYIFIQLLENNILVPQVMSRAVNVNPLVTIIVLLVGYNLAGVMGAILSVPMVLLGRAVLQYFFYEKLLNGHGNGSKE